MIYKHVHLIVHQCFDAVGWVTEKETLSQITNDHLWKPGATLGAVKQTCRMYIPFHNTVVFKAKPSRKHVVLIVMQYSLCSTKH